MKVYIKPWEEALKSAKEFEKRFVDTVDGMEYIIGISCRYGDWGHIVEAKKVYGCVCNECYNKIMTFINDLQNSSNEGETNG